MKVIKSIYQLILFLYCGFFILKAMPKEIFMSETKLSVTVAFVSMAITNLTLWIVSAWLLLRLI